MVLIFSSNANASHHVVREAEQAVEAGVPIIPFRIDASRQAKTLNYYIRPQHWLDATAPPIEAHVSRLGDAIERLLKAAPEKVAPAAVSVSSVSMSGTAAPPGDTVSAGASDEAGTLQTSHARLSQARRRLSQPRVLGAFTVVIAIMIIVALPSLLNPPHSPPVPTSQPSVSPSEDPEALGTGALEFAVVDYANPNATLKRGENITLQLYPSGTYQIKSDAGEIAGTYALWPPHDSKQTYDIETRMNSTFARIELQPNGAFSWSEEGTLLYSGQYTWSTPFKAAL